jgi:thioesterase domain-containing protein
MHAGGGDPFEYRYLAASLPEDQPVYASGMPELDESGTLPTVELLAAKYLREIRKLQKRGPYQLCGHSFGGLVAYEVACLLANEEEDVSLLALIDTRHPASSRNLSIATRMEFYVAYLTDRIVKYGQNLLRTGVKQIAADATASISHRATQFAWKISRLVSSEPRLAIPGIIRREVLALHDARRTYTPRLYSGKMVLFRALSRDVEYKTDITLGWILSVTGSIDVHPVPGDHLSIMRFPYIKGVGDILISYLHAAPQLGS